MVVLLALVGCDQRGGSGSGAHLVKHFPAAAALALGGTGFARGEAGWAGKPAERSLRALDLVLPPTGAGRLRLGSADGFAIEVQELGLTAEARLEGDSLVYASARGASVWASTEAGFEEWLDVEEAGEGPVASWEVSGGTLRQAGDAVLVLDAEGKPRFRVTAPAAHVADGAAARAWLRAEGSTLVLFTSGRGHVLVDPFWAPVADLPILWSGTLTLLLDGRVLAAGAEVDTTAGTVVGSSFLLDPATGVWTPAAPMFSPRTDHSATLLRSGKVFIAGGSAGDAEVFDPGSGAWTLTSTPLQQQWSQAMTMLQDGTVLLTGGGQPGIIASTTSEIWDPATGNWHTTLHPMTQERADHALATLQDGRALACGGIDGAGGPVFSCELYNPVAGTWTPTGRLAVPRTGLGLTQLASGKVISAGGNTGGTGYATTSEVYDPVLGTWTNTLGALLTAREHFTAGLLPSGKVLVAGGWNFFGVSPGELYDPGSNFWTSAGPVLANRYNPVSVLLPSGRLLLAGGEQGSPTVEVYEPGLPGMAAGPNAVTPRSGHTATLLPGGKVLVAGGLNGGGALASAQLFDPAAPGWADTGALAIGRSGHRATLLPGGKVLVSAGLDTAGAALASAQLFDPATGLWASTGGLAIARQQHTQTLLDNGKVLVVGGADGSLTPVSLASVELFDPSTGSWTAAAALPGAVRARHTATLLPGGKVLVVGGTANGGTAALASALVYDPALNTWTATANNPTGRFGHTASALPGGRVLVAGGFSTNGTALASAQLYTPATNQFTTVATGLSQARGGGVAVVLVNGKALVAGGADGAGNPSAVVDVYDPLTRAWVLGPPLVVARQGLTATLLPGGKVLLVDGDNAGARVDVDLYDEGRQAAAAMVPALTGSGATPAPGGTLTLSGTTLTGVSDGASGRYNASRTNYPLLLLQRADSDAMQWLPPSAWTGTSVTAPLPAGLAQGLYWIRAVVQGVPSPALRVPILGALQLTPTTAAVAPRQPLAFSASYPPPLLSTFAWTVPTNGSGATVNQSGGYTAGVTPGTDVVRASDAYGAFASATVTVGPGVSLSPSTTTVPPGATVTFVASGGGGTYTWVVSPNASGAMSDVAGHYVAGRTGNTDDTMRATDQFGNVGTAAVHVSAGVAIAPLGPTAVPRGTVTLTASGGSGTGYLWTLPTNASGASVIAQNAVTGAYTAGTTGGVTDVVKVTDSLGNTAQVSVSVGPGVALSPPSGTAIVPRGSRTYLPSGGSGTGYTWSLILNPSGASINSGTGAYLAGAIGGVTDTLRVQDSLGNFATATVPVSAGCSITPSAPSLAPRASRTFSAAGGSGTGYVWTLLGNASGATLDPVSGAYQAGFTGGVADTVQVTDSLQNTATAAVSVTAGVSLLPATVTRAPRQPVNFSATGGSGVGFSYSLATDNSGATISPTLGTYQAGATGNVSDVVQVVDSLGNSAQATVTLTAGVTVGPAGVSVPPKGGATFLASGGGGSGYGYLLATNASGGSIGATTGVYQAGPTGNVTDLIKAVDRDGNVGTVPVQVTAAVSISPPTATTPPNGAVTFAASGGTNLGFAWSLPTNASGGTIVAGTGAYHAGATPGTDVARVADSLGNVATVAITVTNALAITPSAVTVPPRGPQTFSASGGSGAGLTWVLKTSPSGGSLDTSTATPHYLAGTLSPATDTVQVTDSLGNVATATIAVSAGVSISPATSAAPPRGAVSFTASGGSASGFTWALSPNRSGGTVGAGGLYTAGATPGVIDVVLVTDSLGNQASRSVVVGAGVSISPATPAAPPRGPLALSASGGSGTGFTWTFVTDASGGSVDRNTGAYLAGATGGVSDVVQAADSLGNLATVSIAVGPGLSPSPPAPSVPPQGALSFSATGGSGLGYQWVLLSSPSRGALTPSGEYLAGTIGGVTDTVQLSDSLGNVVRLGVTVTPGVSIDPPTLTLSPHATRAFSADGGSGLGYQWLLTANGSQGTVSATGLYTAGPVGGPSVADRLQVTDSLGNSATALISITDSLLLSPAHANLVPGAAQQFTAAGGTGTGFVYSVYSNTSGASIDAATGAYLAGHTGRVTDTVRVTDSAGATSDATVTVGPGLVVEPATVSVGPGRQQAFAATGGSGAGLVWSLQSNSSRGSIDASTGSYTAGSTGGVTDVVLCTDSLGNTATAAVTVTGGGGGAEVPAEERPPVNGWQCGCHSSPEGGALLVLAAGLVLRPWPRRRRALAGAGLAALLLVATGARAAAQDPPTRAQPAGDKKKAAAKRKKAPAKAPPPVAPPPDATPAPPPEPALPALRPGEKPAVAVLDVLVTVPGEKLDASAFTEILVSAAAQVDAFRVLSSKELTTILGAERQRQLLGCSEDTSCMAEIGEALGARYLLQASLGKVGDTYLVTARLIDASRARVLSRGTLQTRSANQLLEATWQVSQQVFDGYGASLPAPEAARWAARPPAVPPASLAQVEAAPSRPAFGASVGGIVGYQPLSVPGKRTSVGGEVYATMRAGRFDLGVGLGLAPSPGARLTAMFAVLDGRFRLDLGLRGAAYFGTGIYGGGVGVQGEFALTPWLAIQATAGTEAYPVAGGVVLAVLGGLGVGALF